MVQFHHEIGETGGLFGLIQEMEEKDVTHSINDVSEEAQAVGFKYVKANFFRVIHADGAWGGISPKGDIHMAFYNERAAIPDVSKLLIGPDGRVLEPERFEASSRLVREVETDVIFDLNTARALRTWLDKNIEALERRIEQAKAESTPDDREAVSVDSK